MLSDRTHEAIIQHASKLKLKSYAKNQQLYSDDEINYIKKNWNKLSDYQMAQQLNRTQRSIKWMRSELGLFRQNRDRDLTYDDLNKYLRGNTYEWKLKSIKECNNKCILTGSEDFAIHHLYNFSYILTQFIDMYNFPVFSNINDYPKEILSDLLIKFQEFHATFPLGVCVDKELHKLFHHIYGKSNNTPEQWNEFKENYKKGKYNH